MGRHSSLQFCIEFIGLDFDWAYAIICFDQNHSNEPQPPNQTFCNSGFILSAHPAEGFKVWFVKSCLMVTVLEKMGKKTQNIFIKVAYCSINVHPIEWGSSNPGHQGRCLQHASIRSDDWMTSTVQLSSANDLIIWPRCVALQDSGPGGLDLRILALEQEAVRSAINRIKVSNNRVENLLSGKLSCLSAASFVPTSYLYSQPCLWLTNIPQDLR